MQDTDFAAPSARGTAITKRARGDFDEGQYELIRTTVAKDCNAAELAMFLEVCARHDLDPFTKQAWAIKIRGQVQTVVSRDGLLAVANRHTPSAGFAGAGEFRGCKADVVREHDYFDICQTADDTFVDHRYRDAAGAATADKDKRGRILGAWAVVRRREHSPTYFFAEWATYNSGQNVWKSHPEAMIVKSAEAMALRKAFSISGVVGEGEMDRQSLTDVSEASGGSDAMEWPDDEALADELRARFEALNYRRAKQRMLLRGLDHGGYLVLRNELDEECRRIGVPVPEVPAEADVVAEAAS